MRNAGCKKFEKLALLYEDISADMDRPLRLLSDLLLAVHHTEVVDDDAIESIGFFLRDFMNKKLVYEHYIFGRSLQDCTFSDAEVSGELCKITLQLREKDLIEEA